MEPTQATLDAKTASLEDIKTALLEDMKRNVSAKLSSMFQVWFEMELVENGSIAHYDLDKMFERFLQFALKVIYFERRIHNKTSEKWENVFVQNPNISKWFDISKPISPPIQPIVYSTYSNTTTEGIHYTNGIYSNK